MERKMDVTKKTKILYLITGLKIGGAEMVLYRLLKGINREKFQPVVVSIIPADEIGNRIKRLGIKVLSLNAKFKYNPLIIFKLISIFRRENVDILHSFLFHSIILGRIVGKVCSVPIIISSIRNNRIGGFLRKKLLQITKKIDNATTVVSENAKNEMKKNNAIVCDKTIVIYNGVNLNEFKPVSEEEKKERREEVNLKDSDKVLISVGRLHKAKGYIYLIKAMKILREEYQNIKLIIIGEGEEKEKIKAKIKELNLEKDVFLLGQKDNVSYYLNASDVFVMPSLWEGFPNSLIEAMSCELPVVATNVGGIPEVVKDKMSGILVEPSDSRVLASEIKFILDLNMVKRKNMGKIGREIIKQKFSLDKMIENNEALYNTLLNKKI